jgi:hypothetical protein
LSDDTLANAVVRALSEYLQHRERSAMFDARLENLLNQVEVKLLHSYGPELVAQFREHPGDDLQVDTLRLHLTRAIAEDRQFAEQLAQTYGGAMAKSARRRRWRAPAAAIVAVAAVCGAFLLGRATVSDSSAVPAPAPPTVTATVDNTVTETQVIESSSSATPPPSSDTSAPETPGDGGSLAPDTPVLLKDLPVPNGNWQFERGDHDVQFTQYNNSLWGPLATCNSTAHSREQQFRLTNFSRIEVKAAGTDREADIGLIVRFEVLVNGDDVNPIASATVNPGEAKGMRADLPANVFSLTLRMSVTSTSGSTCQRGNAVWGSPYVVAAGS